MNKGERVIRVPMITSSTEPCAFVYPIPSPQCPEPGTDLEIVHFVAEILFPKQHVKILAVSSEAYERSAVNDSSMLDLLLREEADISAAFMSMTQERNQLLDNLGLLFTDSVALAYKDPTLDSDRSLTQLHVRSLFPTGTLAPLLFLIALYVLLPLLELVSGIFFKKTLLFGCKKLRRRWNVVVFLFLGLFLGLLQTKLVLHFNNQVHVEDPFLDPLGLLEGLESKRYTAVSESDYYKDILLDPKPSLRLSEIPRRFHEASKHNPPLITTERSEIHRLLVSSAHNFVLVTSGSHFLRDCMIKQTLYQSGDLQTAYVRPGLKKEMRELDRGLIENINKFAVMVRREYAQRQMTDCSTQLQPSSRLRLEQVQGIFWFLLFALLLSTLALCLEHILARCNIGT